MELEIVYSWRFESTYAERITGTYLLVLIKVTSRGDYIYPYFYPTVFTSKIVFYKTEFIYILFSHV